MEIKSTTETIANKHPITTSKNNETSNKFASILDEQNDIKSISDLTFEISQNISQNELDKIFEKDKDSLVKATMLKNLSNKTDDDIFNKVIFNNAKDMDTDDMKILSTILDDSSSIDRFSGILLSPEKLSKLSSSTNIISNNKLPLNSYKDSYEFINSTIEHLEQSYKNNKFMDHPSEAIVSEKFHQLFLDIESKYVDIIDDDTSVLGEYTRTVKPLILEEIQEDEESEHLKIAMKFYGLDSTSSLQKFEYKLIKDGYSRNEARERASLYSQAGLLGNKEFEKKFGVVVHDLSMLGRTPELKDAMMEAYGQMDTKTLRNVISRVNSFPRTFDDMKNILGEEGQYTPQEIMQRSNDYWDNKYGTSEQIVNHFLKTMAEVDLEQKFTTEDLSYIKDGIQLLMDIFKEKIDDTYNEREEINNADINK